MTGLTMSPAGSESNDGQPPVQGDTFTGFLEQVVREEARASVRESALAVLGGALGQGPQSTGLVVGRVQSGKTLSYEGVISLARDSEFAVVIVISGISNPLLAQGQRRLKKDLNDASPSGWTFLDPADNSQGPDHVGRELGRVKANWMDAATPSAYKETAVVVVLKNYNRIYDLAEAIKRVDLSGVRVLVVDDEADQASLNTKGRRGAESPTYTNLKVLRASVPNHYYLQYTATPQAPLLISIDDALSPDFVRVLEPGDGYTGGEVYFGGAEPSPLVRTIKEADLEAAGNPSGPPPGGLLSAFQLFLIGAAHVVAGGRPETRSMLVHPSRGTADQGTFATWIRSMTENWQDRLKHASDVDPVKLREEFRTAWSDLKSSYPEIANFDECWAALGFVLNNLDVTEVNTRLSKTPVIQWTRTKFYVLIGGQAIDRGFTVEGLTVTYMPRGAGMSIADTIQQRARFFGYKSHYLGLCRVFLDADVRDAFSSYVHHEREMLTALRQIQSGQLTLKQWRRRFYLDPSMQPTRASVMAIPMTRVSLADKWITDRVVVREDAEQLDVAVGKAERILANTTWSEVEHGHQQGYTSPRVALELLESIGPLTWLAEEQAQALAMALARLSDDPANDHSIAVYWIRPGAVSNRKLTTTGGVQIFQGRSANYLGDRSVGEGHYGISLQLHRIAVQSRDGDPLGSYLVTAWHIPSSTASGWIIEVGS
ncbi:Z1 domain-containing protein [Nocardioides sp. AE5]|uniref:Z1 domain-containing protein n=1 Tax=Nocardioides sp. AE5 TaxID=2962573 RepID=UPI002880ECA4|nr:Z1 domain-containing protein [Nocardioides sp. AE5]MDT0202403.1 Z1 domain-containing protein [Nocardioides sp. AE5]